MCSNSALCWWMSYSTATDGKQLSVLRHFVAFSTKDSWSCAAPGKYKPATYFWSFLKSGLRALPAQRLPSQWRVGGCHRPQCRGVSNPSPISTSSLFILVKRAIDFRKYFPNEPEELASVSSGVWFIKEKGAEKKVKGCHQKYLLCMKNCTQEYLDTS